MSEIEELRRDIATLEAAQNLIADGDGNGRWLLHDNIVERKKQLAKLEAEAAAKADPWAIEKQVIETLLKWSKATHGNAAARYARHLECQVDNISAVAEVFRRDFESARKRIAELEAELAKRPVVWCLRNKETGEYKKFSLTSGIVLYEKPNPDVFVYWEFEPYTGEQP